MKYSVEWLKEQVALGGKPSFIGFWGEKNMFGEFSNFYLSNFVTPIFNGDDYTFKCSEQYFMYVKAITFNSLDVALEILELKKSESGHLVSINKSGRPEKTPFDYKKLGRKVKNYNDSVWESVREGVMLDALHLKFNQNERLKAKLLATGNAILVEASPYDSVWGVKLSVKDKQGNPLSAWRTVDKWKGSNLLGFALMEVRDTLSK